MLDIAHHFETFPELETERCILRAITMDDSQDVFDYISDDKVTKYLPWDTATKLEEAEERITRYQRMFNQQTGIVWGIVNKENHKLMGMCLLFHLVLDHHRGEIGYALGSRWWRQGFMLEVATAVLDYCLNEIGFHSLEAKIDPNNIGSQGLLEKLGFVQEGYFREDFYDATLDKFTDTAVFSLLKSNWRK